MLTAKDWQWVAEPSVPPREAVQFPWRSYTQRIVMSWSGDRRCADDRVSLVGQKMAEGRMSITMFVRFGLNWRLLRRGMHAGRPVRYQGGAMA